MAAVNAIFDRMAATTKRTEKEQIIKESLDTPNFCRVVEYALDPFKMYGISSLHNYSQSHQEPVSRSALAKYNVRTIDNLFSKLDDLAAANGASNNDKYELSFLAAFDKDSMKVVNRILRKDLRCGAGIRTFKKYIPALPLHEVMLCESDFPKFRALCGEDATQAAASIKLDGVRTWAIMPIEDLDMGNIRYTSRNGMAYENFDCFSPSLRTLAAHLSGPLPEISRLIFDGEAISKSRNFDSFCGKARSKQNVDVSDFVYYIFDFVAEDIHGTLLPLTCKQRGECLAAAFENNADYMADNIQLLPARQLETWEEVKDLLEAALAGGEEGLILKRNDSLYSFGRSRDWCKIKNRTFSDNTVDLPVVGKVEGTGAFAGMLGALIVDHKGTHVKVGSGYTVEQRQLYWAAPPKMIEVAFQDKTKDGSLRFPIFIKVRDDKVQPEDAPSS